MAIYQLVYISASTVEFSDDDLNELLSVARANNHAAGISGMLLYHGGSFIQVLEGEQASVERIFNKIEQDDRHSNTTILLKGETDARTFADWAMGFLPSKSLNDVPEGFHPFFRVGFLNGGETEDAARKVLLAFKEGRWRLGDNGD